MLPRCSYKVQACSARPISAHRYFSLAACKFYSGMMSMGIFSDIKPNELLAGENAIRQPLHTKLSHCSLIR